MYKGILVSRGIPLSDGTISTFCTDDEPKNSNVMVKTWANQYLNSEVSACKQFVTRWKQNFPKAQVLRIASNYTTGVIIVIQLPC